MGAEMLWPEVNSAWMFVCQTPQWWWPDPRCFPLGNVLHKESQQSSNSLKMAAKLKFRARMNLRDTTTPAEQFKKSTKKTVRHIHPRNWRTVQNIYAFQTINGLRDVPMEQISTVVEEKPFMSSLNTCPEVCCRKGWGRHDVEGLYFT